MYSTFFKAFKTLASAAALSAVFYGQASARQASDSLADLKAAVVANFENMDAHKALFKAAGKNSLQLKPLYDGWIAKNPNSKTIRLAVATAFYQHEYPEAKAYLTELSEMDPSDADVWFKLSIDASRWGDEKAATEYMRKASEAAPTDPGYAFYYAMSFEDVSKKAWKTAMLAHAKRFPDHERGAQGLYWLAARNNNLKEKIKIFELLRSSFDPKKFSWSSSGMSGLYDAYLQTDPNKAKELAVFMDKASGWPAKVIVAEQIGEAKKLLKKKNYAGAESVTSKVLIPRYSQASDMIYLLKAEALAKSGKVQQAYDTLQLAVLNNPTELLNADLKKYGKKLGKDAKQISADTWALREKKIYDAPDFTLDEYLKPGQSSLKDYRGKVVLLTFWFPGCGPCRGEFPHFENALRKFNKDEVSYVGINVFPEQDEYVVPFMKTTGYTFTPLRATNQWAMEVYKVRGQPTNFLIDQNGKIVFANFRTDGHNERTLQLMIEDVLANRK